MKSILLWIILNARNWRIRDWAKVRLSGLCSSLSHPSEVNGVWLWGDGSRWLLVWRPLIRMFSQRRFNSSELPTRTEGIEKIYHDMVLTAPGRVFPALLLAQALLQQSQALSALDWVVVLRADVTGTPQHFITRGRDLPPKRSHPPSSGGVLQVPWCWI